MPFDIGKVELVLVKAACKLGTGVDNGLLDGACAVEERNDFLYVGDAIDVEIVDYGCFACIVFRKDEAFEFTFTGFYCHRKGTFYWPQASVKRELAHNDIFVKIVRLDVSVGGNDTYCQWQVVSGAFFAYVGRSHINDDVPLRYVQAALVEGRLDALLAFLYGVVGQADNGEVNALLYADFNGNCYCVYAKDGTAVCLD